MSEDLMRQILVSNQMETFTSFGLSVDTGEQVYIPAAVAKACELKVGKVYKALLVPNRHEQADTTPWMCAQVDVSASAGDALQDDLQAVRDALSEFEMPVTTEESEQPRHLLERAWREGVIVRVEAKQSPIAEPRILWAADMDCV